MRPVNLIPADERRGDAAPMRAGMFAYGLVALLVVVLGAVLAVTLLGNTIADRKASLASLETQTAQAQAHAESLSSYVSFQGIHDARVQTVQTLATSRFDWERVLHELSRVLPQHIWLTNITGTVSPDVQQGGGTGLRSEIPGPALELVGCGRSQTDVARLVAAMKDIDGVTRVLVSDSAKSAQATASAGGSSDGCQTRPTVPLFNLVAAFDGVAVDATATAPTTTTTTTATATTADASAAGAADSSTTTAPDATGAPTTDPGTPSDGQQQRIDTGKSIAGAGG